jgi:hypothetical protein
MLLGHRYILTVVCIEITDHTALESSFFLFAIPVLFAPVFGYY